MKKYFEENGFAVLSLILALIIGVIAAIQFLSMHHAQPLYPSNGLSRTEMLSKYNPHISSTSMDTEIYFFEGEESGGKVLILGGTHPNEPAGFLAAYLILENIIVTKGTVILIPRSNNSAFTHNDPMEGQPQYFTINGKSGPRHFRFGSRITNPIDQWPDPEI